MRAGEVVTINHLFIGARNGLALSHMAMLALAHVIGDKTKAAHRRGHLFEKRRRRMADWARFCASPLTAASYSNVLPVREHAP